MFLYIVLIGLFSMTFNLPISGSTGRAAGSAFKLDREGMQALDSRLRIYGEGDPEREAAIRAFQVAAQPQIEYPPREDGPLWGPGPREDGPLWGPGPREDGPLW